MHPFTSYWDRGASNVPDMTGARHLLDARDMVQVCADLDIPLPMPKVLDVGCGTGRLAPLCDGYMGVDIAPSAIAYCEKRGLLALLIDGPDDAFPSGYFGWVTCISVFTHIDRAERQAYLAKFAAMTANVLVDIIPGDGTGDVPLWTAVPEAFEADAVSAGFEVVAQTDHFWDDQRHRYYRLRRVA